MARQPRIVFADACYHVVARGSGRRLIVRDERDRAMFLATMGELMEKTGWRVLAWVLLKDHYHWVVRTPQPNLVEGMRWFQNTYTRRFSARHGVGDHLFGGRYKAIVVEAGAGGYLPALMDYVHLNPVRAGLAKAGSGLAVYAWSSLARGYGDAAGRRPGWLAAGEGLALFCLRDTARGRREFLRRLEERARGEKRSECGLSELNGARLQSSLRRGWYWGGPGFGEALAKRVAAGRSGAAPRKGSRRKAEEWLALGWAHFGLTPGKTWDRTSYRARAAIAWALTRKTSVPQKWIAERLGLRNRANVSQLTRRFETEGVGASPSREIKAWMRKVKG